MNVCGQVWGRRGWWIVVGGAYINLQLSCKGRYEMERRGEERREETRSDKKR
jgi:hypothetical protein